MLHPDVDAMLNGIERRAEGPELDQLRSHLAVCAPCATEFGRYGQLLDAMDCFLPIQDASEVAIQRAFDIFNPVQQAGRNHSRKDIEPRPSMAERITTLVFDSWAQPAVAGMRSFGRRNRQIALTGNDYDLHLSIGYSSFLIQGQLLARDGGFFEIDFDVLCLDADGAEISTGIGNILGEFAIYCEPYTIDLLVIMLPDGTKVKFQVPQAVEVE